MRSTIVPLLATVVAGCGRASPEAPRPAPAASPAPVREVMTADHAHSIPVCVVRNGELAQVAMRIDTATGDTTTLDGRPFTLAALTGEYAGDAEWYRRNDVIVFGGFNFLKYGIPRQIASALLERAGEYRGVPVFAEAGAGPGAEIIYVPDRPGCTFQTYTQPHAME